MTVPDQSLTIREILDRYVRGIPFNDVRIPVYDDDGSNDFREQEFNKMDKADQAMELQLRMEEHKEIKDRVEARKEKNRKYAEERRIREDERKKLMVKKIQDKLESGKKEQPDEE